MGTGRVEAFSDGVIAILITIMVLELRTPHSAELRSLYPLVPVFASYALSFVYLGIYWNNHHHMFLVTGEIGGGIAGGLYVAVAIMWLIPDRRIERVLEARISP